MIPGFYMWAHQDSNLGPPDYESGDCLIFNNLKKPENPHKYYI